MRKTTFICFRSCLGDRLGPGPVIDCHLWHRLPPKITGCFLPSCGKWASLPRPSPSPPFLSSHTHSSSSFSSCCRSQRWQVLRDSESWHSSNSKIGECVWVCVWKKKYCMNEKNYEEREKNGAGVTGKISVSPCQIIFILGEWKGKLW